MTDAEALHALRQENERLSEAFKALVTSWGAQYEARTNALENVIHDLLETMEMQENREKGEFLIRADVAWHIWNAAKTRAREVLHAAQGRRSRPVKEH